MMYFLIYLIFSVLSNRIYALNNVTVYVPTIDEMYPLPNNELIETISAQFHQSLDWEYGNMPTMLPDAVETSPLEPKDYDLPKGPGIIKTDHRFQTDDTNPYPIDDDGVHYDSEHHIFLVRHGLYYYTEDEPSSHLLRYGKYQARMAGFTINHKIREILATLGPLTRPIKLVSSTQTRALETLYNIRLQLDNNLEFEPEIIQDAGLTECVNVKKQRKRWYYFVREYLQPIKSNRRENTITIIASHGNLLTTFDHIIRNFINKNRPPESFSSFQFPPGVGLSHAETLVYRTIGTRPIHPRAIYRMNAIPITVNHAHLRKDFYYEWAALHKCRSYHGREDMENYIKAAVIDNVFGSAPFDNPDIDNYQSIVYWEMVDEFNSHILPMMVNTCRTYLYRLQYIQANTNFETFNRLMSPIPVPESEEEQSSVFNFPLYEFNAYGMPFPVISNIQKFRENPTIEREYLPYGTFHPDSRDEKTSHLTRLGINQVRGITSVIHRYIHKYMELISNETYIHPINVIAEPTIHSTEACFNVKTLLEGVHYKVSDLFTDLGLQYNYFQKKFVKEFILYQRIQIMYMLQQYLRPDQTNPTRPSLQVHILCGDGRLFTAFRQELALSNILMQPYTKFSLTPNPKYNALKHAHAFLFESIGNDALKLHDILSVVQAKDIPDEYKLLTEQGLQFSVEEYKDWFQKPSRPCLKSYFVENRNELSLALATAASPYHQHLAKIIRHEWDPYLAGLMNYACRLQLTMATASASCGPQTEAEIAAGVVKEGDKCKSAGPGGDCA